MLEQQNNELGETSANLARYRSELADITTRILEMRADLQKNGSNIASLEALQHEDTLDNRDCPWNNGYPRLGLADAPRLIDTIEVEKGWETAFETVAGQRLQDISLADLHDAAGAFSGFANRQGRVDAQQRRADPLPAQISPQTYRQGKRRNSPRCHPEQDIPG